MCALHLLFPLSLSFHVLLLCRTKAGISWGTTHDKVFSQAMKWSNVVALDEAKPHTLPSGTTFFRVNESLVGNGNLQVDKFILAIQVFNPDLLATVTSRLSDDKRVVIVTMPNPDKFIHENRTNVAHQLAMAVTGNARGVSLEECVKQNYLSFLTIGSSQADEHQADAGIDIDIPMKKVFYILPPGIEGLNAYFNDGELDFYCLDLSKMQHALHICFRFQRCVRQESASVVSLCFW